MAKKKSALDLFLQDSRQRVSLIITAVSLLCLLLTPVLSAAGQCPENYTQAQVDITGCSVGADIGAGLFMLMAGLTLIAGLFGLTLSIKSNYRYIPLVLLLIFMFFSYLALSDGG